MFSNRALIMLITGILTSCSGIEKNVETEKIHVSLSTIDSVSFYDVFSKIEIIPLETTNQSQIGKARKVILHNDAYYVEDRMQNRILVFDKLGSFQNAIGRRGRGPGEYNTVNDFNINPYDSTVEILSIAPGRILKYDTNGKHIITHRLPTEIRAAKSFCMVTPDTLIITSLFDEYRVFYYSLKKNEIFNKEKHNPNYDFRSVGYSRSLPSLYRNKDNIIFSEIFSNDVYKYRGDSLSHVYSWDFGEQNFDVSVDLPQGKDRNFYSNYINKEIRPNKAFYFMYNIENEKFIITRFVYKNEYNCLIYQKEIGEYFLFTRFTEGGSIVGQADFFNGGVFTIVDATFVEEAIPKNVVTQEVTEEIRNLELGDNPVIVKYYY